MSALTYDQRKALRRLSRGQSISRRMLADPVISQCFTWSEPTAPPKPIAEMNVAEYCDWEVHLCQVRPVINDHGHALLAQIEPREHT